MSTADEQVDRLSAGGHFDGLSAGGFFREEAGGNLATDAMATFYFEDRALRSRAGENLAAALLAHGVTIFRRTAVSASPRAPWCMMGVCFDCLVRIDGQSNQQACLRTVCESMRVSVQDGASEGGA